MIPSVFSEEEQFKNNQLEGKLQVVALFIF